MFKQEALKEGKLHVQDIHNVCMMIHRCAYIYICSTFIYSTLCEHPYVYNVPIRIHMGRGTCHLGWLKILGTIQENSAVS